MVQDQQVWFVTGCSSGLGAALAKQVYASGHVIVATARSLEMIDYLPDDSRVLRLTLDVTSRAQVDKCMTETINTFGQLDVVVNNAGYGLLGDTESIRDIDARAQMETNFWGLVNVTQAALPLFRSAKPRKGGLFVQISSMGGRVCFPGTAYYHASKFALEGYTDSLSKEMHPDWNVKFLIIQLGSLRSSFVSKREMGQRHPAYLDPGCPYNQLEAYTSSENASIDWGKPENYAKVVFDAVQQRGDKGLPLRLPLGADAYNVIHSQVQENLTELEEWEATSIKPSPNSITGSADFFTSVR